VGRGLCGFHYQQFRRSLVASGEWKQKERKGGGEWGWGNGK
jgi:hypothetical protein